MKKHLRAVACFFLAMAFAAFLFGFIASWIDGLSFLPVFFVAPFFLLTLLVVTALFLGRGIHLARQTALTPRRTLAVLAAPLMLVGTIFASPFAIRAGAIAGDWTRLTANYGHYEAIIAKARQGRYAPSPDGSFEQDGGVTYVVDRGPPVRVAFNPDGLLDNWSGIVFDPTGDVRLADGFDPKTGKFIAPERVTELFGGDLLGCRHIRGDYYKCSFT